MFSYFSVFDKNMMHFFSWTLLIGLPVHPSAGRTPGRWVFFFCRGNETNAHVRFHRKGDLGGKKKNKQKNERLHMNFCDSTDVRLASFLLQRLSYLIGWEVNDWNRFNDIEVLFFPVHLPDDLMLTFLHSLLSFCFQLCIIVTVDFPLIPTFTFALLWKWTCWRCSRACELWELQTRGAKYARI